jgi:hypothetical protein
MLVSHKLKFLYIHIPKNWGSSIYKSFKKIDPDLIDTHMPDEGNKVDKTHMLPFHYSKYDVIQSAIDNGYKVFSTIRDPKERFYSSLKYAQKYLGYKNHKFFHYCYLNSIRNKGYTQNCMYIHGCPQNEFIFEEDKKITDKDFICDENLFKNLSDYFGVELEGSNENPSAEDVDTNMRFEDFLDIYEKDVELYNKTKEQ